MAAVAPQAVRPRSVEEVRADFPILAREIEGRPLAYLDSAATAQKPRSVIEAIDSYYRNSNANVHRSMHLLAEEAEEIYEGGRRKVAALVGAGSGEIVFVRNATEAINLVRFTWAREHVGAGDAVLITAMEHHSNVVPWQLLCEERGARLEYLEIDGEGRLDLSNLEQRLERGVKLVALTHVSNVLGTINPIAEVAERAHAAGAAVLVDGAQAVPQLPVDVTATGADFYAFTGHKMYGPTGIGMLWGRRALLDEMPPFLGGGSMIKAVEDDHSTWAPAPAKFEAGTMPVAEAIGLGAAVDWLAEQGMEAVREHARDVVGYAVERLREVPGLTLHGPEDVDRRGSVCSFALEGVHPHDTAEILGRQGVCVRAGHHCAQPLMRRLGVSATSRASFALHSTRAEVDRLIDGLGTVREVFA